MDNRKLFFAPHVITAWAMLAALLFPCVAGSVSIGEVSSQSKLGEPLLAQVDLVAGSDEQIENTCLSLVAPDSVEDDISAYLTDAHLSLKSESGRQYVSISTTKPFNDAYAKLRLQVKCSSGGSVIKTLTILPDLDVPVPQAPVTLAETPAQTENASVPPPVNEHDIAPAVKQNDSRGTYPETKKNRGAVKTSRTAHKRQLSSAQSSNQQPPASPITRNAKKPSESVRLILSSDSIDESRFGKADTEKRAILLAKQRQRDDDEQMSKFLAMQNQVKQLQDELGAMKLQLAQLGVNSGVPSSIMASSAPAPAAAAKPPELPRDNPALRTGLWIALGLILVIVALRFYSKGKPRIGLRSQQDVEHTMQAGEDVYAFRAGEVKQSLSFFHPHANAAAGFASGVSPAVAQHNPGTVISPAHHSPQTVEESVPEEDSLLEEAKLYSTHGRAVKAASILQEIIKRNPSKTEAWTLLLSIFSSLGKATEFEDTAREFLKYHKDSPLWGEIQAMGRTFENKNPLYDA